MAFLEAPPDHRVRSVLGGKREPTIAKKSVLGWEKGEDALSTNCLSGSRNAKRLSTCQVNHETEEGVAEACIGS